MPDKNPSRTKKRTDAEAAKEQQIRNKFQREKPSLDELLASGDLGDLTTQGEYFDQLKSGTKQ